MAVSRQQLTLEEFLRLPEEEPALEFEGGRVTQKPLPTGKHSALQGELAARISRFAEPRKLGMAFPELRATFAGASRVPDVAIYRWDRIPKDKSGEVADDFREPPDATVEIVSPEQGVNALIRRCLWYVANGVRVALLMDPVDHSVIVFRPEQAPQALHGTDRSYLTRAGLRTGTRPLHTVERGIGVTLDLLSSG